MTQDFTSIAFSFTEPQVGLEPPSSFPIVRYDSGALVYQEALIHGQYVGVNWSAMGRSQRRASIWKAFDRAIDIPDVRCNLPWHTAQHAFALEMDGQLLGSHWEWVDGKEIPSAQSGCREAIVTLRHTVRPVTVEVHTRLDGSPILVRWLVIHNTGDKPAAISAADPWSGMLFGQKESPDLPLPVEPGFTLGRYRGLETLDEGEFNFEPIPLGGIITESRMGSSGFLPPYAMVRNQNTGETFITALAYSGNWRLELRLEDTLRRFGDYRVQYLHFRFGPAGSAPIRVMEPGESVTTPAVHLGKVDGDLDACVHAWHTHLRASVALEEPEGLRHLVEYNHGANTLNIQINEAGLLEEVEMAAALGAELFMVDAGWFGEVSLRWTQGAGDWYPHELLPNGMTPIFDRVRKHGMRCGMWYEIERAGPKSNFAKDHPDWLMKRNGLTIHHLDLSKPEVARHVEETIIREVEKYQLDCFRLDYNIRIGDGSESLHSGYVESTMWKYYDNLWRIFENVRRRFPNLLLQNCASGGCRNDLGMLSRFHYTQISDNMSPAPMLKALNGSTFFLLPAQCSHIIGSLSAGVCDLDFALRTGLFEHGTLSGIMSSMTEKNDWAVEQCRYYVNLFKQFVRPLFDEVRVFHHTPFQTHLQAGDWMVLEYATTDGKRAYVGLWRLLGDGNDEFHFTPRGLRRDKKYRVNFENKRECMEITGAELINNGLHIRAEGRLTSELLRFEELN